MCVCVCVCVRERERDSERDVERKIIQTLYDVNVKHYFI